MPVSYLSVVTPLLFLVGVVLSLSPDRHRRIGAGIIIVCIGVYAVVLVREYSAGARLRQLADDGNAWAHYEYSRWIECQQFPVIEKHRGNGPFCGSLS